MSAWHGAHELLPTYNACAAKRSIIAVRWEEIVQMPCGGFSQAPYCPAWSTPESAKNGSAGPKCRRRFRPALLHLPAQLLRNLPGLKLIGPPHSVRRASAGP